MYSKTQTMTSTDNFSTRVEALKKAIAEAEKEIVLIDNYVDLTVLERFAKKKKR